MVKNNYLKFQSIYRFYYDRMKKINIKIKILILILGSFLIINNLYCIKKEQIQFKDKYHEKAFLFLDSMLNNQIPLNFKKAVFVTENAYLKEQLQYNEFTEYIDIIVKKLKWLIKAKRIESFKTAGLYSVFSYMCEPTIINDSCIYSYEFEDCLGDINWTNMFVTKLLNTKKGNCHSLPYLYKILSDEMGVEAFLALAPNHLYIKHKDENENWVNLELTSCNLPSDSWITASMGITELAVKNKIYMAPLSLKESIALCILDLSFGYIQLYGHNDEVQYMSETVLKHFPNNIQANFMKSNSILTKLDYLCSLKKRDTDYFQDLEKEYNSIIAKITDLGFVKMPQELYEKWTKSVEEEIAKQKNQKLK